MINITDHIFKQASGITQAHITFLKARQAAIEVIAALVSAKIKTHTPHEILEDTQHKKIIYNQVDLEEFATGSLEKVFGSEYAVFKNRRVPRIPNGDLLLFNRVIQINGTRRDFDQLASITTEYDVPKSAWYIENNSYAGLPFAILQEIALQPCGFLSAWLGTSFLQSDQDLYFRNLDGQANLLFEPDLAGKVITTNAHLVSTTVGGGTIIQKFNFNLSVEHKTFFEGESVFGYFQAGAMANQVGLDSAKSAPPPSFSSHPGPIFHKSDPGRSHLYLPMGQLDLLKQAEVEFSKGSASSIQNILMKKSIDPLDWFFSCHFFQDPVMPGSLGIEAAFQLIQALIIEEKMADHFTSPRFALIPGNLITWKYRGQITQKTQQMTIKVNLQQPKRHGTETFYLGDASVWADHVRIYEIKNLGIKLIEAQQ